jgi:hypothetical protein
MWRASCVGTGGEADVGALVIYGVGVAAHLVLAWACEESELWATAFLWPVLWGIALLDLLGS